MFMGGALGRDWTESSNFINELKHSYYSQLTPLLGNHNRSCEAGDQWGGASTTQIFHNLPPIRAAAMTQQLIVVELLQRTLVQFPAVTVYNQLFPGELMPSAGLLSSLHTCSIDKLAQATDRHIKCLVIF